MPSGFKRQLDLLYLYKDGRAVPSVSSSPLQGHKTHDTWRRHARYVRSVIVSEPQPSYV
jgi:hypothetical protein